MPPISMDDLTAGDLDRIESAALREPAPPAFTIQATGRGFYTIFFADREGLLWGLAVLPDCGPQ